MTAEELDGVWKVDDSGAGTSFGGNKELVKLDRELNAGIVKHVYDKSVVGTDRTFGSDSVRYGDPVYFGRFGFGLRFGFGRILPNLCRIRHARVWKKILAISMQQFINF